MKIISNYNSGCELEVSNQEYKEIIDSKEIMEAQRKDIEKLQADIEILKEKLKKLYVTGILER